MACIQWGLPCRRLIQVLGSVTTPTFQPLDWLLPSHLEWYELRQPLGHFRSDRSHDLDRPSARGHRRQRSFEELEWLRFPFSGATVLHAACACGRGGTVEQLLDAGASPLTTAGRAQFTPLHAAAFGNHVSTVATLLRHAKWREAPRPLPTLADAFGFLPLAYAVGYAGATTLGEFHVGALELHAACKAPPRAGDKQAGVVASPQGTLVPRGWAHQPSFSSEVSVAASLPARRRNVDLFSHTMRNDTRDARHCTVALLLYPHLTRGGRAVKPDAAHLMMPGAWSSFDLHRAVAAGQLDVVELMLAADSETVERLVGQPMTFDDGNTPLHVCASPSFSNTDIGVHDELALYVASRSLAFDVPVALTLCLCVYARVRICVCVCMYVLKAVCGSM